MESFSKLRSFHVEILLGGLFLGAFLASFPQLISNPYLKAFQTDT